MKSRKEIFIPQNYDDYLPELMDGHFAWKMKFSSKSDLSNTGQITYYQIRDVEPRGNFVLVPGLASNTRIEPLMRAVTYWSLRHKYNIYALDTFLGDFRSNVSVDAAQKNTVPEFIELIDAGLEIVSKMSIGKWTCVVGHSLGGIGALEVFNRRVQQNRSVGFSGAILFAPFLTKEWSIFTKGFLKHYNCPDLSDEEFYKKPVGLYSLHDSCYSHDARYVSIYPGFLDDVDKLKPRPELMAQYKIPVTLVAGGADKKSPVEYMRDIYNNVKQYPNGDNMRLVVFPTGRHSFIDQHKDWGSILKLIKSQYKNRIR